jgi:hypothetical protein
MTIIRTVKSAGRWEAVPTSLVHDDRLGWDTRAVAIWLLCRPDGWQIRAGALSHLLKDQTRKSGHVGREISQRFLRELTRHGYMTRTRSRRADGTWEWHSVFSPVPATMTEKAVDGETGNGPAGSGSANHGQAIDGAASDKQQTPKQFRSDEDISKELTALTAPLDRLFLNLDDALPLESTLTFPPPLDGEKTSQAMRLIGLCPPAQRQEVIDEVAAIFRIGKLKASPLGLLRRLSEIAAAGRFTPTYSISHRERERREADQRRNAYEARQRVSNNGPRVVGELLEKALAGYQAQAGKGDEP